MASTTQEVDLYPCRDEVRYGRGVWQMGEDGEDGVVIEGHGRRSLAAASCYAREMLGASRRRNEFDVEEVWVVIQETCGCTEEEHAKHVADSAAAGLDWIECDCEWAGLAPCHDLYGWTTIPAVAGGPRAVAMTEIVW